MNPVPFRTTWNRLQTEHGFTEVISITVTIFRVELFIPFNCLFCGKCI